MRDDSSLGGGSLDEDGGFAPLQNTLLAFASVMVIRNVGPPTRAGVCATRKASSNRVVAPATREGVCDGRGPHMVCSVGHGTAATREHRKMNIRLH